ncbi:hypothetical protein [Rhizobium sp. C4]|uniref:hypothetical protein n=1 Tax=Rhizobium sp. C4 TaxID=1349800 RepID=UPI001E59D8AC|nr:hypothetical protein [Rhizobium sp. C4]MCD2175592.1 hypothetical protein [Rhizobium sp. C4]
MLFLAVTTLLPVAAMAAGQQQSTGWVSADDFKAMSNKMKARGMMPVSIACKGDSGSTIIRESIMLNVTFAPDTDHRPWKWVWGTMMGHYTHYLVPKGWKLVSQSGFTRPKTGLFVPCGVFVGPPGSPALYGAPTH